MRRSAMFGLLCSLLVVTTVAFVGVKATADDGNPKKNANPNGSITIVDGKSYQTANADPAANALMDEAFVQLFGDMLQSAYNACANNAATEINVTITPVSQFVFKNDDGQQQRGRQVQQPYGGKIVNGKVVQSSVASVKITLTRWLNTDEQNALNGKHTGALILRPEFTGEKTFCPECAARKAAMTARREE